MNLKNSFKGSGWINKSGWKVRDCCWESRIYELAILLGIENFGWWKGFWVWLIWNIERYGDIVKKIWG